MISVGKTVKQATDFGMQSSCGGHTGSGLEKQGCCILIWSRDESKHSKRKLNKLLLKEVGE